MPFTDLLDLAAEALGAVVVTASDEFFAPADNLLRPEPPVFVPGRYTERGQWMDGWETRRRRAAGHDRCVIRLGVPGAIRGVVVDTTHFKGNAPEACSLDACFVGGQAGAAGLAAGAAWTALLARSRLEPDAPNGFALDGPSASHVRLNIHPDGGVGRLRLWGVLDAGA